MSSARWTPATQGIPDAVVVADARLTNYLAASAIAILLADYFAAVNEELDFVWKKRWSIPSILYNRYITIIAVISFAAFMFQEIQSNKVGRPAYSLSRTSCTYFIVAEGLVSTLLVVSFDLMLIMRVWILYGKTRRMSYILFPMLLATYLSALPGCYFTTPVMRGTYFAFYALPPMLVTFTMFIMTVYKCNKILHADKTVEMPLVTLFLRDGIVWFFVVFGIDGTQMIIWATGRATLTQVLIILYSQVSSRVLLNTKSLSAANGDGSEESEKLLPHAVL
ncbi:hypothetical protein B0H11DRAFT_2082822 [Mycena galericulata]|nr:hypothetical protein B0H11DRAFT_2082822 [Mycena galericulata]